MRVHPFLLPAQFSLADELCELKEENPVLTAKEKESVEEKEETQGSGREKGQQEVEKEVTEEKDSVGGGVKEAEEDEEELEELRAQVFSLLLELDQTREDSQRHEESALELQGGYCTKTKAQHTPAVSQFRICILQSAQLKGAYVTTLLYTKHCPN